MRVLIGNLTFLCDMPNDSPYERVPVGTSQVASSVVYYPLCLTIDPVSGDIFWGEQSLSNRVMVLRAAGGTFRIGGISETGDALLDAPALNSPFRWGPQGIAFDPTDHSIYFIDGPTNVLRIRSDGILVALALIPQLGAGIPLRDGPFANATAAALFSLSLSADSKTLYTTDTSFWSIVRAVDIAAGTITRVAGSFDRLTTGSAPLNVSFNNLVAARPFVGGNLLVVDMGAGLLRSVVLDEFAVAFCPSGYTCPCGTPVPCTDPRQYCPVNELVPHNVSRGYYASGGPNGTRAAGSSMPLYSKSLGCPIGSFCANGLRFPCWPGTYGVGALQATPSGCLKCPAGTFSAAWGAVGSQTCLPCTPGSFSATAGSAFCSLCPLGTASAVVGATSVDACIPCAVVQALAVNCSGRDCTSLAPSPAITALPGSAVCTPLGTASLAFSATTAALEAIVNTTGNDNSSYRTTTVDSLLVAVCLPLAVLAFIPTMHLIVTRGCDERAPRQRTGGRTSAVESCIACCLVARRRAQHCLRVVDIYSLRHYTDDGTPPVKKRTSVGGATTMLAVGCVACLAAVLIVQFIRSNALTTTSLLPAPLPTLQQFSALRPRVLTADETRPAIAPPTLSSGLELRVAVMGPTCSAPLTASVSELISGSFVSSVVHSDPAAAAFVHLFSCSDCAFGPMSALNVTFAGECQSFAVTAAAVGATGSTYIASFVGASPSAVMTSGGLGLTGLHVTIQPQLEVVDNRVAGFAKRGYSVSIAGAELITAPATRSAAASVPPVSLYVDWATSGVFVYTEVVAITSLSQLASSIIGLLGLLGGFGVVFTLVERACPKPTQGGQAGLRSAGIRNQGSSARIPAPFLKSLLALPSGAAPASKRAAGDEDGAANADAPWVQQRQNGQYPANARGLRLAGGTAPTLEMGPLAGDRRDALQASDAVGSAPAPSAITDSATHSGSASERWDDDDDDGSGNSSGAGAPQAPILAASRRPLVASDYLTLGHAEASPPVSAAASRLRGGGWGADPAATGADAGTMFPNPMMARRSQGAPRATAT